jgi:hypothetical protein
MPTENNSAPFEIIAAPYELWTAAVGASYPDVDEVPDSSDWTLVGTSGDRNYTGDGVTVDHSQTLSFFKPLGSTGAVKATRTEEEQKISLVLADLSLEQYTLALNGNTITPTAAAPGVPGTKKIGLMRGPAVRQYALLLRGPSPYMEDGIGQYEVPVAVQSGQPKPVFRKGADQPADLALEFMALEDPDASTPDERFGRFVAQTDPAET